MLSLAICVVDKVEVGLDQKLSMPQVSGFHSSCNDIELYTVFDVDFEAFLTPSAVLLVVNSGSQS